MLLLLLLLLLSALLLCLVGCLLFVVVRGLFVVVVIGGGGVGVVIVVVVAVIVECCCFLIKIIDGEGRRGPPCFSNAVSTFSIIALLPEENGEPPEWAQLFLLLALDLLQKIMFMSLIQIALSH